LADGIFNVEIFNDDIFNTHAVAVVGGVDISGTHATQVLDLRGFTPKITRTPRLVCVQVAGKIICHALH